MLNRALSQVMPNGETLFSNPSSPIFRHMAGGLVGDEAGTSFFDFCKNYDRNVSAEQVLNEYSKSVKVKVQAGMTAEALSTINEKLVAHCESNRWGKKQAKNVAAYMRDMGNQELVFALWTSITSIKDNVAAEENMRLIHRNARDVIMVALGQAAGCE